MREVEELTEKLLDLTRETLLDTTDEQVETNSLKKKCDAMALSLSACIEEDKKRLAKLRKRFRCRKDGSKRLKLAEDNAAPRVLSV